MESDFGTWRLGEPLVWGLSLAVLFHFLCLDLDLNIAQLFKSEPFSQQQIIMLSPV